MTSISELYAHTMAIAEGRAELASDILNIVSTTAITDEEKLRLIRLFAEKQITKYEGLSRA